MIYMKILEFEKIMIWGGSWPVDVSREEKDGRRTWIHKEELHLVDLKIAINMKGVQGERDGAYLHIPLSRKNNHER